MSAILFGSIGSIADTSELQRQSFNQAFEHHGLDWHWSRKAYLEMLKQNGGKNRIKNYADSLEENVDAEAIHRSKSEIFQSLLQQKQISPREGVVETIATAKEKGIKLGLVTTTSEQNVASLLTALSNYLEPQVFSAIVDTSDIKKPKPAKDAYVFALDLLNETANDCVAIEDNLGGIEAARSAGINCVAFPNQNTAHHDFTTANLRVDTLGFERLSPFVRLQNHV